MKKTIKSLLAASALLVPLASIAVVPAAQASTTPVLHGGAASPNYPSDCVDTAPAVKWSVNATGIHIKSGPNGTNRDSISESATFISDTLHGSIYVTCYAPAAGQFWVYGESQAKPNEYGWIGCDYLDVLHSTVTCTQLLGRP
jgi:hypothetical protein